MKKTAIIILLGLLIYSASFFNGFVWDDEVMFQNPGTVPNSVYFRPIITAVYSTIHIIFGQNPFFFHFFQVFFHIFTAILIFTVFKQFFKEKIALILSLIFLIHPANVEAVCFASAMQEVLFVLLGLIGLKISLSLKNFSLKWVFLSAVFLLMSLLVKETGIVFFILVFGYFLLFKRKSPILLGYSVFSGIFLLTYFIFRLSGGNLYVQGQGLFPIMRVSVITRLFNIPSIIWYYLKMFFYPFNLAIAQHWVIKTPEFYNFFLLLGIEIMSFIVGTIYIFKKKDKIFAFFFLWFLIGLLPHLQIVPLNMTVAERWSYFPMIGLLGMIGAMASRFEIRNLKLKKLFFAFTVIVISIFSVRSLIRTLDWRDGLALFGHDIKNTSSFDLQNNYGTELFRVGRYNEAKKYFEISVKLAPYWWVNWNNLGAIYERENNYQKAAECYQKAINNGQYYLAYENLAKLLVLHSKDYKGTEAFLQEALRVFPKDENLLTIKDYFLLLIERK